MAAAAVDVKEEILSSVNCAVCVERYRDPRILECAHHFCKVCLVEIAERHPEGYVICPICRHITKTNDVTNLPRYRIVNNFVGEVDQMTLSPPGRPSDSKSCCKCKENKADRFCFGCNLTFCSTCSEQKQQHMSKLKGHKLYRLITGMQCKVHDMSVINVFCNTCNAACCSHCAMDSHQGHNIDDIKTTARSMHKQAIDVITQINESTDEVDLLGIINEKLERAKHSQLEFTKQAKIVKDLVKEFLEKFEEEERKFNQKISCEIKQLDMMKVDLQSYIESRDKLKAHLQQMPDKDQSSYLEMVLQYKNLPKYDQEFYKKLITKDEIELPGPKWEETMKKIATQVKELPNSLKSLFYKESITIAPCGPFRNLSKMSSFDVGFKISGLAVDSKRQILIIRSPSGKCPIMIYDYQGCRVKVLGSELTGINGNTHGGVALDVKRDLILMTSTAGEIVRMDVRGKEKDRIEVVQGKALHGIEFGEPDLYLVGSASWDGGTNQVYLVNAETKDIIQNFASGLHFNSPHNVHIFPEGGSFMHGRANFAVSNYTGADVMFLDAAGREVTGRYKVRLPWGLCADPGGRLIVGDCGNERLLSVWREDNEWEHEVIDNEEFYGRNYPIPCVDRKTRILFTGFRDGHIVKFKE